MSLREAVEQREQQFARVLRDDGLRVTHQRLEIVRELARATDHPDAEAVLRRVRERVPTLSQDTVYRTLAVLAAGGAVERISMPRATRFDPDKSAHHHFLCERCGKLEDVAEEAVAALSVPGELPGIGAVRSVQLQLKGVCESCEDSAGSSHRNDS